MFLLIPSSIQAGQSAQNRERFHPAGYLLVAGAAVCWAFGASLAKLLFARDVDPLTLAQVRAAFSFLALLLAAVAWRPAMLRVPWRLAGELAVLGIAGIAASNYTYLVAIQRSNVTTAVLIQYTAPVWVTLYAVLSGSEPRSARKALAAGLSFGGCALAAGGYRPANLALNHSGVAYALAAALTFSFFNIWGKRMARKVEVWTGLLHALGAATLFWFLVRSPLRLLEAGYSGRHWALLVCYAMVSVLLPFTLFYSGLRRLPATHAMVTSTLEPVLAALFAFLIVGEQLAAPQVAGMAAVIAAIVLLSHT